MSKGFIMFLAVVLIAAGGGGAYYKFVYLKSQEEETAASGDSTTPVNTGGSETSNTAGTADTGATGTTGSATGGTATDTTGSTSSTAGGAATTQTGGATTGGASTDGANGGNGNGAANGSGGANAGGADGGGASGVSSVPMVSEGDASGNNVEALSAAQKVVDLGKSNQLAFVVDATLLPAATGAKTLKGKKLINYRKSVTTSVLTVRINDDTSMQNWTSGKPAIKKKAVQGFLSLLMRRYPKSVRSVSMVSNTGELLAIGDAASGQKTGVITLVGK